MNDLYTTDERGRHVYHVYNVKTPYGTVIRTIKYDFGDKNYGVAFVARDCLDMLGYKYDDTHPNSAVYKFVSKENIINGKDTKTKKVYIRTRCPIKRIQIKPVVLVTLPGFFELVIKSNMPNATIYQYWVINMINDLIYRNSMYENLIKSDPNYTIIDGIPHRRKRIVERYSDAHGIDTAESMHALFN